MTTIDPVLEARLRSGFRYFNRFMLLMWRLGLGPWLSLWPDVGGRIMVLTTVGRKSGEPRRTPLNYALVDGDVYCTAGFGGVSDWYKNIRACPQVEVWLPEGWWAGVAEDVTGCAGHLDLMRAVLRGSGVVAPLAGVDPRTLSDVELGSASAAYRLVRIRREAARTGADGPGDLAWVWPVATKLLLLALLLRRKDRARR
jgi:deazaflavin-dependent oxidoreductase (nitroreductase family)